jgi:sarcosine oxidase
MSGQTFDVIVVGLGAMGSAAARELARRGTRVLGLEQYPLGHDQGSSHGRTRIIRRAYYEHPDYVPLVSRAFEGWRDLERQTDCRLLTDCPCLSFGPPGCELVEGVLQSAQQHQLPVEKLSPSEVCKCFPAFRLDPKTIAVLEPSAGILAVEDCVRTLQDQAIRNGALLYQDEPVRSWKATPTGVSVTTGASRYEADRLVLTAGPWAGQLFGDLGVPLKLMRQVPLWFHPTKPSLFGPDMFPIFIADTPEGYFYGIPAVDEGGLKVAEHYGAPEVDSPSEINRSFTSVDEIPVRRFIQQWLPDANGLLLHASVCTYTLTPDRHFIIDRHPLHSQVAVAAGFSGHGFKFAPVVGEVLADLTLEGKTNRPIDRFRINRF